MPNPIYELLADLDGDGTFETDWSIYVKGLQGLGVARATALDAFGPRGVTILLDNEDKRFSPKNTSGPYSPDLKRGVKVRLKATVTTPVIAQLLDNPSLENDAAGYSLGTRITTDAKYGGGCLDTAADFDITLRDTNRVPVTAGLNYIFRGHIRRETLTGPTGHQLEIHWLNSGGGEISASIGASIDLGDAPSPWLELPPVSAVAPVGAVRALLTNNHTLGGGEYHHDAFMFYQGTDLTIPYTDGDSPGATWDGPDHESTSSRGANPIFPLFKGTIRSFSVDRVGEPLMAMNCTGSLEDFQTAPINAGPFQNKEARWVIDRLFDIMTRGQVIDDGGFVISPVNSADQIENFIPEQAGMTTGSNDAAKSGGSDPVDFAGLEGDFIRFFQGDANADGKHFTLVLTSRTNNTDKYDLALWVGTSDDDMDGLTVQVKIEDDVGVVHTENIVLDKTTLVPVRVLDKQYNGAATIRRLRFYMPATITAVQNDWFITALSFTPSKHRIERTYNPASGSAQWDNPLEYLDAFDRSALATLEEAFRSTGAWFYEDADGGFFIEDFDQRSPTAIPKLRLTDTAIEDGHYVAAPDYDEPATNIYNRIRVASFGDVTLLTETERTVWAFEPLPRVYAADRRVLVFATYMSEETEGLIVRRAAIADRLTAGNYDDDTRPLSGELIRAQSQPYIENRGRGGVIIFQTDTSIGLTLAKLRVAGRAWHRSTTERVFVEQIVSGTEDDEPRELLLEMPAQGHKTQIMTDLATWAARYGNDLSIVRVEIQARTVELLLEVMGRKPGLPVRYRQVTGPGASMADELYYVEGWTLNHDVGGMPRLTLLLEEAA